MDHLHNTDAEGLCFDIEVFQDDVKHELVSECRNQADLQNLSNKITMIGNLVLSQLESSGDFPFSGDSGLLGKFKKSEKGTLAALIELGLSQANYILASQSLEWELNEDE